MRRVGAPVGGALLVVAVVAVLLSAGTPGGGAPGTTEARAAGTSCAALGPAAGYDIFADGDYTAANTQLAGGVAAAGGVSVNAMQIGAKLGPSATRLDVVAGGSITAGSSGTQVTAGVSYGTALTGNITVNGVKTHGPPPFSFPDTFADLRAQSAALAALATNGTTNLNTSSWVLTLTGTGSGVNVFAVTGTQLGEARQININVPAGATTVVNVSGDGALAAAVYNVQIWDGTSYQQPGDTTTPMLETIRSQLLWNFPLATSLSISGYGGGGFSWQGSVLAPNAMFTSPGNGQLFGQIIAGSVSSGNLTVFHHPFSGCVAPPATTIAADDLCVDASGLLWMVVSNNADTTRQVTWADPNSAQGGSFALAGRHSQYFSVADGDQPHTIVVTSGTQSVRIDATTTAPCSGEITVTKVTSGMAPAGPWTIYVTGENGFQASRALAAGEAWTVTVPGGFVAGQVPVDEVPGGVQYIVTEPDPLGGVATVTGQPVTVLNGGNQSVIVTNEFPPAPDVTTTTTTSTAPTSSTTTETTTTETTSTSTTETPEQSTTTTTTSSETTETSVTPAPPEPDEQPTEPPGTPGSGSGPNLVPSVPGQPASNLTIAAAYSPTRGPVNDVFTLSAVVRNTGPVAAAGTVLREIPQFAPAAATRAGRVLSSSVSTGRCTSTSPFHCALGTVAPGAEVILRARVEVALLGAYHTTLVVSSNTPESNTTDNMAVAGVLTHEPPPVIRVGVAAPALVRVGTRVRYRVRATGGGKAGATYVRLCTTVPPTFIGARAPGTLSWRGHRCRDIDTLGRGRAFGFYVTATAAAPGLVPLPAFATAVELSGRVHGSARVRVAGVLACPSSRRELC